MPDSGIRLKATFKSMPDSGILLKATFKSMPDSGILLKASFNFWILGLFGRNLFQIQCTHLDSFKGEMSEIEMCLCPRE